MGRSITKSIFFIVIGSLFSSLLRAQTISSSDGRHFLWFTGHWSKDKPNTFITDAAADTAEGGIIQIAGGKTITVSSDGGVAIGSADIDDWNKKITDGINDLEKIQKELSASAEQGQEWAYHFNQVTMSQLDSIKAQWASYKIEKKQDILNPQKENKPDPQQNLINNAAAWCEKVKPQYEAIVSFYQAHKKDRSSDYNNLPPPEMDFNCVACDTELVKQHDKQANDYVEKFFKPEADLIKEGMKIEHDLLTSGIVKDVYAADDPAYAVYHALFHNDKSDPSRSGPCAYLDRSKLSQAVQFLLMRCLWRADKLLNDNRKNFKVAMPVIRTYLCAVRQNELMGFKVDTRFNDLGAMVLDAYNFYFNKLTKDRDWSQLANIPFIFGLARQYSLLTGQETNGGDIKRIWDLLNRFQLNIEMEAKIGDHKDTYLLAHLKGKAKIAPEFAYGENKCYQWVVVQDQPNQIGQPLKKGDQKINVDLLDNEIITKDGRPTYTGTKKYWCMLSQLKMDFCHPGSDSILITAFLPDPSTGGTWLYPNGTTTHTNINSLDQYFKSIDQIKADANSGALQQAAMDFKKQAEVAMQHAKELQSQMGDGKIDPSKMGDYQKFMNEMNALRGGGMNNVLARAANDIAFPLEGIQNNATTLFKKRFDAKEINPTINGQDVIIYGYYTVEIEYKE